MGAPASFSRLMDLIMEDAEHVISYLDDVLIHSSDHKSHIAHVAAAIDRIGNANLRLNPAKCTFGASNVEYLGNTITSKGVQPGFDKSAAVRQAKPPTNHKELKSFLGLANYFRSFIHHFSHKAAPLFRLTRGDSGWSKGTLPESALAAFNQIREEIAKRPVMAYPKATGDFHLFVDAALGDTSGNDGGLGAVLMQDQDAGVHRPVAYASHRLLTHEKNYPAFLAEMQAAIFGMETYHHYLVGRRFFLHTDHKPLCKLSTVHTKTLNRLQLKMQEMHPVIRHVNGKDNTVADFLSRYHGFNISEHNKPIDPAKQAAAVALHSHKAQTLAQVDASPFRIRLLQRDDPEIRVMYHEAKDITRGSTHDTPIMARIPSARHLITIINDILYASVDSRRGVRGNSDLRIAVPQPMRQEILNEAHNSLIAGHSGRFKTRERLALDFWWPSMDADIATHITECPTCQRVNATPAPGHPPLVNLPQCVRPCQRLHVDLFGPLQSSPNGNTYVLVLSDAFTKFVRVHAIPNKRATTVALSIYKDICAYGCPDTIVSDQGREFTNILQTQIWDSLNIEHKVTTPYHPQCNSSAEVFNKTMKHFLATAILDAEDSNLDWELYLAPLSFSYNTAISSTTRVSPFDALFGYDPRVPLWNKGTFPGDTELNKGIHKKQGFGALLSSIRHSQFKARQIVHHNQQASNQRTQDAYNKHHTTRFPEYAVGDRVLVRILPKPGPNPKLSPTWEPAIILERKDYTTYRIRREGRRLTRSTTVNVQMLKPFHQAPESMSEGSSDDDDQPRQRSESESSIDYMPGAPPPPPGHDSDSSAPSEPPNRPPQGAANPSAFHSRSPPPAPNDADPRHDGQDPGRKRRR